MSLFSLVFFSLAAALVYHLFPRRYRWGVLLAASLLFYLSESPKALPLLIVLSLWTWFCAKRIAGADAPAPAGLSREEKKARRAHIRSAQRRWLIAGLCADFAVLAVFKYLNDLRALWGASRLGLLLPLGLSFYTFQITGYLLDVYGGKIACETSPLRFLLFSSFFPQLIQGPIGRYDALAPQLREPKALHMDDLVQAALLILYGLMKKLVIADRLAPFVSAVFDGGGYGGAAALLGVLAYAAQQYCDFSGGIDLVTGLAELFGIQLAPNFRRPYFSVSLADFWRRWHISLGAWMRDYVFYPFALCRPVRRLSKLAGSLWGQTVARTLPAAVGNLLVFFLVGLWHGAAPNYIAWGLYNGLILAASSLLEPAYKGFSERHARLSSSRTFHVLRVLRTFVIVNIGWFFDRSAHPGDAFRMIGSLFVRFSPEALTPAFFELAGLALQDGVVLACALLIVFIISLLCERGVNVRAGLAHLPYLPRLAFMLVSCCAILLLGVWGSGFDASAFIYNGF
ncbi:MAG: MBOAT family O-acyltransferase [Candidatus Ventricola sp.]